MFLSKNIKEGGEAARAGREELGPESCLCQVRRERPLDGGSALFQETGKPS
jgi:hypothetical protein